MYVPDREPADLDQHLGRMLAVGFEAFCEWGKGGERERAPARIGDFEVLDELGHGGVAVVYRVADDRLDRELAVKVMRLRFLGNEQMAARFRAEARLCASLAHPGIVPIHELGNLPDGRPYFAMKVIAGQTLTARIDAAGRGAADRQRLLGNFLNVCDTIAYAHSRGIVHGDLKPSNIMVGAFGEVQIVDWGFAHGADQPRPDRPHLAGTPGYLAPELAHQQGRGDTTPQSDVYALGVTLAVLLTHRHPIVDDRSLSVGAACDAVRRSTLSALESAAAVPIELRRLARRCLSAAPEDRPSTAAEVQQAVAAYLDSVAERTRRLTMMVTSSVALCAVLVAVISWLQIERVRDDAAYRTAVGVLIDRTRTARSAAQAHPADAAVWADVERVARGAVDAAATRDTDGDLQEQARLLLRSVEHELGDVRRRSAFHFWLKNHRPPLLAATGEQGRAASVYTKVMSDFGFVLAEGDESILANARACGAGEELVRAFDDWSWSLRLSSKGERDWQRLVGITQQLDTDEDRLRLRRALLAGDVASVREFVDGAGRPLAATTCSLLASSLFHLGDLAAAVQVLRNACLQHSSDYHLHSDLSWMLRFLPEPDWREVVAARQVATAIRPQSPRAQADLGLVLLRSGRLAAAEAKLLDVIARWPSFQPAWRFLAHVRFRRGEMESALRAGRRALELYAGDYSARALVGRTLMALGHWRQAVVEYRLAAADHATEPGHRTLGWLHVQLGQLDDAWRQLSLARELGAADSVAFRLAYLQFLRGDFAAAARRMADLQADLLQRGVTERRTFRDFREAAAEVHAMTARYYPDVHARRREPATARDRVLLAMIASAWRHHETCHRLLEPLLREPDGPDLWFVVSMPWAARSLAVLAASRAGEQAHELRRLARHSLTRYLAHEWPPHWQIAPALPARRVLHDEQLAGCRPSELRRRGAGEAEIAAWRDLWRTIDENAAVAPLPDDVLPHEPTGGR